MSLLPCPFCGGDGEVRGQGNQASPITVKCIKCYAQGPPGFRTEDARQLWNSRMLSPEELAAEPTSKPAEAVPPIMANTDPRPAEEDDWRLGDRSEDIVIPRGMLKAGDVIRISASGVGRPVDPPPKPTPIPAELTTRLGDLADRLAIAPGQGVGAYMAELCTQSADAIREVLALVQPTKGGER
jgi:hypothetical protein